MTKLARPHRFRRQAALTQLVLAAVVAAGIALPATAQADDAPVNLPLTDDIRAELVEVGAVLTGRPVSEFNGLRPERAFLAEYPGSHNQYAAAALQAAPGAFEAGVNLQDQNSYMVFIKAGEPGARWIPRAVGFGPIPAGEATCPVPQKVRDLWNWPAGKCYPPPD
jgi:hypothetical protein